MGLWPSAAVEMVLSDEDREALALWARGESRRAGRARIVLACAEPGALNARVAEAFAVTAATAGKWRRRFAEAELAGLDDSPRPGGPKADLEVTAAERAQLEQWARRAKSAQALAQRARIVLACADGKDNKAVAAEMGIGERWFGYFTD